MRWEKKCDLRSSNVHGHLKSLTTESTSNSKASGWRLHGMKVSFRSPFRAGSNARQSYKQKLHQNVFISSAEQRERERKLKRTKEYKESLTSPQAIKAFIVLVITQVIITGSIVWAVHSLLEIWNNQFMNLVGVRFLVGVR